MSEAPYSIAWKEYKNSTRHKHNSVTLKRKGLNQSFIDTITEHSFASGWSAKDNDKSAELGREYWKELCRLKELSTSNLPVHHEEYTLFIGKFPTEQSYITSHLTNK